MKTKKNAKEQFDDMLFQAMDLKDVSPEVLGGSNVWDLFYEQNENEYMLLASRIAHSNELEDKLAECTKRFVRGEMYAIDAYKVLLSAAMEMNGIYEVVNNRARKLLNMRNYIMSKYEELIKQLEDECKE